MDALLPHAEPDAYPDLGGVPIRALVSLFSVSIHETLFQPLEAILACADKLLTLYKSTR